MRTTETVLLIWLVTTFAIGTAVLSPMNGLALSGATTWGLWALLSERGN